MADSVFTWTFGTVSAPEVSVPQAPPAGGRHPPPGLEPGPNSTRGDSALASSTLPMREGSSRPCQSLSPCLALVLLGLDFHTLDKPRHGSVVPGGWATFPSVPRAAPVGCIPPPYIPDRGASLRTGHVFISPQFHCNILRRHEWPLCCHFSGCCLPRDGTLPRGPQTLL